MDQASLFPESRTLPIVGQQRDITYLGTPARQILNGPETTGMGFWSINPYVGCAFGCAYCYARYAHRYTWERAVAAGQIEDDPVVPGGMPPWLAFERRIFVKEGAPEALRRSLRPGTSRYESLTSGDTIVIGTATDPYQPAERRFRVTRGILEALTPHAGLSITIITKSPLVTRDIDLLRRLSDRSTLSVHVSLITVDRELARRLEPRAPTPESRLRAMRRLRQADIDVSVNCMPVLPGITDGQQQLEALVGAIAETGVRHAGACALRLQSTARTRYLPFIEAEFPALAGRYHRAYANSHSASEEYREALKRRFGDLCRRHGLDGWERRSREAARDDEAAAVVAAASQEQLQLDI